jgi:hypothetical protein
MRNVALTAAVIAVDIALSACALTLVGHDNKAPVDNHVVDTHVTTHHTEHGLDKAALARLIEQTSVKRNGK